MANNERDFKGVWIPKEIWLDSKLTALEKVILTEIDSLDSEERGCWASNEHLAKFCQCSETKISNAISKLTELGYIYIKSFNGRERELKSIFSEKCKADLQKVQGRLTKSVRQTYKKCKADLQKVQDSNIYNNTSNNTFNNIDINNKENSNINITTKEKQKSTKFIPPTEQEVYDYANSRGRGDLAKTFYDYYTATEWCDSKGNKVKSWKGKFITWENNNPLNANITKKERSKNAMANVFMELENEQIN